MSIAHKGDIHHWIADKYPNGVTGWRKDGTCEYCGSLHPANVVAAIEGGDKLGAADRKYGWPHKYYLERSPGKFYTRHLIDATPEQYEAISKHIGLYIEFNPESQAVKWQPWFPKDQSKEQPE